MQTYRTTCFSVLILKYIHPNLKGRCSLLIHFRCIEPYEVFHQFAMEGRLAMKNEWLIWSLDPRVHQRFNLCSHGLGVIHLEFFMFPSIRLFVAKLDTRAFKSNGIV